MGPQPAHLIKVIRAEVSEIVDAHDPTEFAFVVGDMKLTAELQTTLRRGEKRSKPPETELPFGLGMRKKLKETPKDSGGQEEEENLSGAEPEEQAGSRSLSQESQAAEAVVWHQVGATFS